jgi:hypothetical protein
LPDYVQNKLRKAMERPTSENDKPGYIYAYQLLESMYPFFFFSKSTMPMPYALF